MNEIDQHPASKLMPLEPDADNRLPQVTNEMRTKLLEGLPPAARGLLDDMIRNGLGGALGFPGSGGIGTPGSPYSEQVSSPATLFKNLRWFLVSNYRQLLSEAYVELGLIQTICRVPVEDALRGGVEIKSEQLSEDEVQELQTSVDRDDDLNTVGLAATWNRLFGGAGILIITEQDPVKPFDLSLVNDDSKLEFRAVDMWELFWDQQNTDGYEPEIQSENFEWYNYYAVKMHKSRVMRQKGLIAPSFIRPRLRGWGFSVVEALVRSINQYLKATDLGFEVLDEFKLDIFKIKNLVNTLMSPNGQQKVQQRVQLANWQKNYQNALVLDSEDDYIQKQLSFAGLAETMQGIRMQVAADMRMPVTKLFGSQAGGLNADDEADLEIYNAMVETEVRNKIKYDILRILEIKCQKLFGFVPDDLSIKFQPLRMLSAVDEENVKTQKFARAQQAADTGRITIEEYRDIMNRDELLGIQLQDNPRLEEQMMDGDPDDVEEGEETSASEKSKDVDDPGANREDTRKPRTKDKTKRKEQQNSLTKKIEPFATRVLLERMIMNSSGAFDKASYEADGGDTWIDERRKPIFERPLGVNPKLWKKAKDTAIRAGTDTWQAQVWFYKKLGGRFE